MKELETSLELNNTVLSAASHVVLTVMLMTVKSSSIIPVVTMEAITLASSTAEPQLL